MIKRLNLIALAVVMLALGANAQTWEFDKLHSNIGFSVKHMVISNVKGSFHDYDGSVLFDGTNFDKAAIDIAIQMNSIDTDNEKRDGHLMSTDFFEVEKYPVMTFKSTKITALLDNKFKIMGDLTIKETTLPVILEAEYYGTITDHMGGTRAGFSATTKINRQDYNVAWDNKLQDGSLIVGNDVTINLEIELIKAEKTPGKAK